MKFISSVLAALTFAAAAQADTVSYDAGYDDGTRSLTAVTCSDGPNGLITKYGWQTQSQVHNFPYIGGAAAVATWNSPNCGSCWALTYNGKTIYVLAIDHTDNGFNISPTAMNDLTNNQAEQLGRVDATVAQVGLEMCGL